MVPFAPNLPKDFCTSQLKMERFEFDACFFKGHLIWNRGGISGSYLLNNLSRQKKFIQIVCLMLNRFRLDNDVGFSTLYLYQIYAYACTSKTKMICALRTNSVSTTIFPPVPYMIHQLIA